MRKGAAEEVRDAGTQDGNFAMEEREHWWLCCLLLLLLSGDGRDVYITHLL